MVRKGEGGAKDSSEASGLHNLGTVSLLRQDTGRATGGQHTEEVGEVTSSALDISLGYL